MTFIDDYSEETDDFNECDVKSWEWVEYHQNDSISDKDEQDYEPPKHDKEGYSRNWAIISRAIRDEREWTCEECNIELKDSKAKRRILHVHHRDRNKKNNHETNLQVLCISCHSNREGHNHLSEQITDEDSRLIRSLRQKQYDRYKRTKFEIQCDIEKLKNNDYYQIIKKFGSLYLALTEGKLYPLNEDQKRFIDVSLRKLEPIYKHERAWIFYLSEIELEKERCDTQFNKKQSNDAGEDDWDDWCGTFELRCNFEQEGKTQFNRGAESDRDSCFSNNDEYTRKRSKDGTGGMNWLLILKFIAGICIYAFILMN